MMGQNVISDALVLFFAYPLLPFLSIFCFFLFLLFCVFSDAAFRRVCCTLLVLIAALSLSFIATIANGNIDLPFCKLLDLWKCFSVYEKMAPKIEELPDDYHNQPEQPVQEDLQVKPPIKKTRLPQNEVQR